MLGNTENNNVDGSVVLWCASFPPYPMLNPYLYRRNGLPLGIIQKGIQKGKNQRGESIDF